jgi:hypothetical protein
VVVGDKHQFSGFGGGVMRHAVNGGVLNGAIAWSKKGQGDGTGCCCTVVSSSITLICPSPFF